MKTFTISAKNVNVNWSNTTFEWNGTLQAPTATSNNLNHPIKVTGQKTDIGSYTATAELVTPNSSIILTNATKNFSITQRDVKVNWGEKQEFVYNKMVQHPEWNIDFAGR